MTSPYGKAICIANARAGTGSIGRKKQKLHDLLTATGIDFEIRLTQRPGHAVDLARSAMEEGHRYLVAVGGDGTISEVVNGMMGADGPLDRDTVLGVIPTGSGSDFIRTFGLPPEPADAVEHLKGEAWFEVDVGRITCITGNATMQRYFVNIAEAGLGGECVRRAEALPRRVGRLRYLLAFWMTLGRFQPTTGSVVMDGRSYQGRITNLVVANAQFFGGGMRIAPKAHPADGKFDVLVQKGTKRDYVAGISKVFKGEHLPSPAIREFHARRVELAADRPLQVEADGEVLGFSPATFEIIENAYKLKI